MDTRAFDFTVIFSVVPALLSYLDVTLAVAFASIALGSLWGAALSGAKVAGGKALRGLAHGYTYVMRCTPSRPEFRRLWHRDISGLHTDLLGAGAPAGGGLCQTGRGLEPGTGAGCQGKRGELAGRLAENKVLGKGRKERKAWT